MASFERLHHTRLKSLSSPTTIRDAQNPVRLPRFVDQGRDSVRHALPEWISPREDQARMRACRHHTTVARPRMPAAIASVLVDAEGPKQLHMVPLLRNPAIR